MFLILLGIVAGMTTTLSGFGGGLILVVALSLLWDPVTALTVTSMGLMVGSTHRIWMFRHAIAGRVARPLLLGAVPGSVAGALVAVTIPAMALQVLILAMVAFALLRRVVLARWRIPGRAIAPAGLVIGAVGATSGGIGPLLGSLLLSAGLAGDAYIATMATGGLAMNLGRLTGYGLSGAVNSGVIASAALLAAALMAGNWLGKIARARLGQGSLTWLEYAAPVVCAVLAVAGLGR